MPRTLPTALTAAAVLLAGALWWTSRDAADAERPELHGTSLGDSRGMDLVPPGGVSEVRPLDTLVVPRSPGTSTDAEPLAMSDAPPRAKAGQRPAQVSGVVGVAAGEVVAQADVDGRFELTLPEGDFALAGWSPTHVPALGAEGSLSADEALRDVVLVASRPVVVEGFVSDERGAPVADARIDFLAVEPPAAPAGRAPAWHVRSFGTRWTRSDDDGVYRVDDLSAVAYRVHVEHAGFTARDVAWTASRSASRAPELVLARGLALPGRVIGPDLRGLPGAQVFAWQGDTERSAISDDDGTFTLTGLVPGRADVLVSADGCALFARDGIDVPADAPLTLEVSEQRVIAGSVVSPDGAALPDRLVTLRRASLAGGALAHERRAIDTRVRSDDDGRFAFARLDEATFVVATRDPSHPGREAEITTPSGVDDLLLVLDPARDTRLVVEGTACDASDGTPLDEFTITVRSVERDGPPPIEHVFTAAAGRFRIDDQTPGRVILVVASDGYATLTTETYELVADELAIAFELEPARPLALHLVETGGRDIADAELALFGADLDPSANMLAALRTRPLARARTGADGRATFDALPVRELRLVAILPGVPPDALWTTTLAPPGSASDERIVVVPDAHTPAAWRAVTISILVETEPGGAPELDPIDAATPATLVALEHQGHLGPPDDPVRFTLRGPDGSMRHARLSHLMQVGWIADGDGTSPGRPAARPVLRLLVPRDTPELTIESEGLAPYTLALPVPIANTATPLEVTVVLRRA